MSAEIEEQYFIWLCAIVMDPKERGQTYLSLLRIMHTTEFVWTVPGDANRAADARDLRERYLQLSGLPRTAFGSESNTQSILEVLIAFTKHAEFHTGYSEAFWFKRFLRNLGLLEEYDAGGVNQERIENILSIFVWRLYEPNGEGGIFPVVDTSFDLREVELWFQFHEYIESEMIGR